MIDAPPQSASPAWTRPQRIFFYASLAAGLAWSAFVMLASTGWSLDDELAHYLRSHSVWQNPALIFDSWTRVGRNLFHVLPAYFGLAAARWWTLAFAGLAVVLTTLLAGRLGVRRSWLVPLALCFQPWFAELSWGVLTQTPFMLALVGGILALVCRRLILSGLCFGFLPLIRHEGLALMGLWGVLLLVRAILRQEEWRPVILAGVASAVPLVVYNVSAWLCIGELPSLIFLSAKPTELYGHGTLWHFIPISILPAGVFTLVLAAIGLPAILRDWRVTWPLVFFPTWFVLHSVIFWKGLFASAGYYHFLMPAAPGLAIAAVYGANTLFARASLAASRIAFILLGGLVVQSLLMLHFWHSPFKPRVTLVRDPITRTIDAALAWQKEQRPKAPVVICHHIYAAFHEQWVETPARRALDVTPPGALPVGAIVIWEDRYADVTGLPLAALRKDPAWSECQDFGGGSVCVFEKIH